MLTESALAHTIHLLEPDPGWHDALRRLTRDHETLLALDETHTYVVGEGGATGSFGLDPDLLTIGEAAAGGVPLGAYGMTAVLAAELDPLPRSGRSARGPFVHSPTGSLTESAIRNSTT